MSWLQDWFSAQCDGEWEHSHGVRVETLDNPGWAVEVDRSRTALERASFDGVAIERSEDDWLRCDVTDLRFRAFCGPRNLAEAIACFRDWANAQVRAR